MSQSARAARESQLGLLATSAAFLMWGVFPVYWKALSQVPADEVLAHRILWTAVLAAVLLTLQGRWREVGRELVSARRLARCAFNGSLLAVNWLTFLWAVNNDRVLECSLGYFINPLGTVLLGRLVLKERLERLQILAVALATCGVGLLVASSGGIPWVALVLAGTFAVYGLSRKTSKAESLPGLAGEMIMLVVPALVYLFVAGTPGSGSFARAGAWTTVLLVGTGVVTALPLLSFAYGARKIDLTIVGLLQYLGPTCMFLLGVFAFGEPLDVGRFVTFALIWAGLALFTYDRLRKRPREDATS